MKRVVLTALFCSVISSLAHASDALGPVTNLPIPRYVSMKAEQGNVRRGPSLTHRIDWIFQHKGMPLRVTAEYGHWRRVEDIDGEGGWMHYSLLSGLRTVIVQQDEVFLRMQPEENSITRVRAQEGAILRLSECEQGWCRVSRGRYKGWVPRQALWGLD